MYENICTLPYATDVFALALHPHLPIFAVGLSSGHLHAYTLPTARPHRKTTHDRNPSSNLKPPPTPISTVQTLWSTRRHKGSLRTLTYSTDGTTLFSAGTDGLLKAASAHTGRVIGKVAIPQRASRHDISRKRASGTDDASDDPTVLTALSPTALLLGTDAGALHVYDLVSSQASASDAMCIPRPAPSVTYHPHHVVGEGVKLKDSDAEPITAIVALAPSAASSSGTRRAWISAAGGSLAIGDIRKGCEAVAGDAGDMLLCGVSTGAPEKGTGAEKVVVGGARGQILVYERGDWETKRIVGVHKGDDDDGAVECVAVVLRDPSSTGKARTMLAVGLGNGIIKLVEARGKGWTVVGELVHDETGVEGVSCLGFDSQGRMISGGGGSVKIWHPLSEEEMDTEPGDDAELDDKETNDLEVESEDDGVVTNGTSKKRALLDDEGDEEENEDDEESEEEAEKKKRKKRRRGGPKQHKNDHGIMSFSGL